MFTTTNPITIHSAAGASSLGSRPTQQDQYTVLLPEDFNKSSDKIAFFAVYDGHGSEKISKHASENIQRLLQESPALEAGNLEDAIKDAIRTEEKLLLDEFRNGEEEFAIAGSTASLALVNLTKGVLVAGNLGDSHILLAEYEGDEGEPENIRRITHSHKPEDPEEKDRIQEAGGTVNMASGTPRVGALNMSRALGDLQYKDPLVSTLTGSAPDEQDKSDGAFDENHKSLVSSEPYLNRVDLADGYRRVLILTTDGVTNTMKDDPVVKGVLASFQAGMSATDCAKVVVQEAAKTPGSDNSTCIVVFLGSSS
ncbi:phosphatase 2C-like domain-containing protein [Aspergillus avenaceus]|uniref:protein-serine/threonine phosphatase n=1 Tax=Aspergillus avenaceus TaxID=36643 RepID=A0A5N6U9E8_ASPAV|nr:phosphatase 2C-like domain-containing protein [Aspergillus avenaceus]